MKLFSKYYVVDKIAENVIGSFEAISDDMARVMYKRSILDNEKLKDFADQYALYKGYEQFQGCETFEEVIDGASEITFVETKKK